MTTERRTTVLFWCQVALYVTAMVTMLGILITLITFVVSTMRTMEVDRIRDRAMLQQHYEAMADHARAREEHARAFDAMLQRHRTMPSE